MPVTRFLALGGDGFGVYEPEEGLPPSSWKRVEAPADALLCPGFVDIHIHGALGIDTMTASPEEFVSLCDWLAEQGYERWLPTTVCCRADAALSVAERLPEHPMIAGFHLEGPFLSPKFPGAQPESEIAPPPAFDDPAWCPVFRHPKLKIVTLAPEREGALPLISALAKRGVAVSMGHTDATFDEASRGFSAGLRSATHTFNAMRGLHHREPGALGFALFEEALYAELVYDRKHVSPEAASILLKCKRPDKVIAVSDSSPATGLQEGSALTLWGNRAEVIDGRVRLVGTNTLAGSTSTLLDAFRNLGADFGLEVAISLTSMNPRRLLGIEGPPGVLLTFGLDLSLKEIAHPTYR